MRPASMFPIIRAGIFSEERRTLMMIMAIYHPLLSLIAGILILAAPRLLNYIVAIYLIIIGILGLFR